GNGGRFLPPDAGCFRSCAGAPFHRPYGPGGRNALLLPPTATAKNRFHSDTAVWHPWFSKTCPLQSVPVLLRLLQISLFRPHLHRSEPEHPHHQKRLLHEYRVAVQP